MIVGIFLRYFKTYQGINFIPLTDGPFFCGILGDNGVGKSSVLEAMDSFFNGRPWNYNITTKKRGMLNSAPYIVPVFLLERSRLDEELQPIAEALHDVAISTGEDDLATATNKPHLQSFRSLLEGMERSISLDDYYVVPLGVDYKGHPSLSIFNCPSAVSKFLGDGAEEQQALLKEEDLEEFSPLLDFVENEFEYIYIPREIDPERFTQLETEEIQVLMGETLYQIVEERVPPKQIKGINKTLNDFMDSLADDLGGYAYRTVTDRQLNVRKNDVYKLIIDAFFNIRKLHKKQGQHWLEIGGLSSGEKQKAIIEVARNLLLHHREGGANLIMGIDEPESSLHMSACFNQFDSLFEIGRSCRQVLFTSHWYGFLPTIESGSVSVISKSNDRQVVDRIDLQGYREQVKQIVKGSKGKLPYDIRLKSVNDFIQSVITSAMGVEPYHWIICEGSSEKIYFSAYFADLLAECRVRIIPVGGAREIKRIYRHLSISYEDFKDEITGSIFLLTDTDAELVRFDAPDYDRMICRRIVNSKEIKKACLVGMTANPVAPSTEIEDVLDSNLFLSALGEFRDEAPELDEALKNVHWNEHMNSYYGIDWRPSEREVVDNFFDQGDNKFRFAKAYADRIRADGAEPDWIGEVREWIVSKVESS